jgi:hypothetical protein
MIADGYFLEKKRICAGGVVTPRSSVEPRGDGDLRGECVAVAELVLADLKFKRTRPSLVRQTSSFLKSGSRSDC